MDLLGVGVPELIVIIVLALIFVGPRDLPKLAVRAAEFLREIRKMSEGLTNEWKKEIDSADLDLGGIKELSNELTATPKKAPPPPKTETPPSVAQTPPPPEETSTRDQPDE